LTQEGCVLVLGRSVKGGPRKTREASNQEFRIQYPEGGKGCHPACRACYRAGLRSETGTGGNGDQKSARRARSARPTRRSGRSRVGKLAYAARGGWKPRFLPDRHVFLPASDRLLPDNFWFLPGLTAYYRLLPNKFFLAAKQRLEPRWGNGMQEFWSIGDAGHRKRRARSPRPTARWRWRIYARKLSAFIASFHVLSDIIAQIRPVLSRFLAFYRSDLFSQAGDF
jgi:hypothetical protein